MNGIFKVCHGSEPPSLRILPAWPLHVFQVYSVAFQQILFGVLEVLLIRFQFEKLPSISLTRNRFCFSFPTNSVSSFDFDSSNDFLTWYNLGWIFSDLQRTFLLCPVSLHQIICFFPFRKPDSGFRTLQNLRMNKMRFSFQNLFGSLFLLQNHLHFAVSENLWMFPVMGFNLSDRKDLIQKPYGASYWKPFVSSGSNFHRSENSFGPSSGIECGLFRFSETFGRSPSSCRIEVLLCLYRFYWKWSFLGTFGVPYLRRFSFCDYTISLPWGSVHSQSLQRNKEIFVHNQDWKIHWQIWYN